MSTEILKLRTQRSTIVLFLLALVMPIVRFVLIGIGSRVADAPQFDLGSELVQREQLLSLSGGTTFVVVIAILGICGEYRHRTVTWTLLATPDRTRVLLTKFAVYVALGVVYGLLVAAIVTGCTMIFLSIEGVALAVPWDVIFRDYGLELVGVALSVGLAFAFGALVVNQIAAIVGILTEPLASMIVFGLLPKVGRFLPTPASNAALQESAFELPQMLSRTDALLVLCAYLVVMLAAALYLTQRRDIT